MKWRLLVLFGAMSFGILSTIVKLAYGQGFDVSQVVMSQLWLGALICWLLAGFVKLNGNPMKLMPNSWFKILVSGIPLGFTSFAYYQCVQSTPASIAILLLFQFVWMGVIFDIVLKRKWPNRVQIISVVLLLIGTFFAAGILNKTGMNWSIEGIGYGLLAALSYTTFIYVNGVSGDSHFLLSAAIRATGGAIFASFIFNPIEGLSELFSTNLIYYGAPLAIFGMVIPPIFFAWGIPKVGTTESSIISGVELPIAVLSATFILHEEVNTLQWLGVALILFAITVPNYLALRKQRKKQLA